MKKINFREFLWFLILAGYSAYYLFIFVTGKIYVFISPKMFGFIYFSLIVFLILTLHQIKNIFSHNKSGKTYIGYILFLLPLLFGFIVNPSSFTIDIIRQKGIQINHTMIYPAFFGGKKVGS